MEMPELRQRRPDPGSPNVQTRPATDPAPDPRPNPIPSPRSSWKRRPVVQWILLCTLLLAITVGATGNVPVEEATPTTNICKTPECKTLDCDVQDRMNRAMDPCDNFYQYACGGFLQKTRIPGGKMKVTRWTKAEDRLENEVSALIRSPKRANDTMPIRLVKRFYQQCMIRPQMNPILSVLKKLGGWKLLEKGGWAQLEPSWSLVKSVDDFRSHGFTNDYFIRPLVDRDLRNASRRRLYIDQPITMNINRETLDRGMNDPQIAAHYNSMVNMSVLLGAEKKRAEEDLQSVVNFELKLANISMPLEERQNITIVYNPMSLEQLQSRYGYINWLDYFRVVFKDTGIVIDKNETVIVHAPRYFERLGSLLQTTSNRTLANYIMWTVVEYTTFILDSYLLNQQQTNLSAAEKQHRSMGCVEITKTHLPLAVAAQYVKGHVDGDSRRATFEMANELRNAFVDIVNENDWMDNTAKNSCLEKVNSMVFNIGYPDELLDDSKIVDYYRDLEHLLSVEPDYLSTVLQIKQFNTMQKFKMLRKAVNRTDWTTHSNQADVDVGYLYFGNSVQMATGLLQALFLPHDLPRYMNYGTIGPIIGRYITQACDYQGRKVDNNGNPKNWWQADTEKAFMDKYDCYKEQYENYVEPNLNISLKGCTTAAENIADHGGLKVAYRAYKKWAKNNRSDPRLPRLKLSPERMFWISAAQSLCSVSRAEEMRRRITMFYESPDQFRVVGPMSNMDEFSKDFNCPSGSPMNRTEKCKVW